MHYVLKTVMGFILFADEDTIAFVPKAEDAMVFDSNEELMNPHIVMAAITGPGETLRPEDISIVEIEITEKQTHKLEDFPRGDVELEHLPDPLIMGKGGDA